MNRLYKYVYLCLILAIGVGSMYSQRQSPMASGLWGKIGISRSGLHQLDAESLRALGFEQIERVRIWGYGGTLLPEQIVGLSGRGLTEIPTLLVGDKLYFYAEGPTSWEYLPKEKYFVHKTNHYTREGYYLLSQGDAPLRMHRTDAEQVPDAHEETLIGTTLHLHEEDMYSLSKSGRHLYGASLQTTPKQAYLANLPDAKSLRMRYSFMAYPVGQDATLRASINATPYTETSITQQDIQGLVSSGDYKVYGTERTHLAPTYVKVQGGTVKIAFELSTRGYPAHFDYYELNVQQDLRLHSRQLYFTRPLEQATPNHLTTYTLQNTHGAYLFSVNSSNQIELIKSNIDQPSISLRLRASDISGKPMRYLLTPLGDAYTPRLVGRVKNQKLLEANTPADLLVITTKPLLPEALRLAKHYEADGYAVQVATQEQVFNEFNGGTPDATAYRLWARLHYDLHKQNRPGEDCQIQLLLIGDAAYDNRKLTRDWQLPPLNTTELLLSYQSESSLDLSSYTTDDYFGILADESSIGLDESGYPRYPDLKDLPMDIGVGRLPVRTLFEAHSVVNKIIKYETTPDHGAWKMKAVFLADNGDGNSHTRQSIQISNILEHQAPAMELNKIYMSAYPRQNIGGMTTVPGAHRAFMEALASGVLLANYNGHGSPKLWADEQVLTINDIQNFSFSHLPLWITATCDFGNFDAPVTSAGEEILLHPSSGGIALLSTTRVVWDIPNQYLNMAILRELFTPDTDGRYRPLGLVIRDAKNSLRTLSAPENRLNFVLLGSPLLRLPIPPSQAVVSKLSGQPLEHRDVRIHALERIPLEGYIQTANGEIDGDFCGRIELTIYDGEEELETIDNFSRHGGEVRPVKYRTYRNIIYTGQTEVKDGRYSTMFDVPKDVAYSGRNGRISLYAYDPKRHIEVGGLSTKFLITPGIAQEVVEDTEPPRIHSITLSGHSAFDTPRVAGSSMLIINLSDASSINQSSASIGHRATLTLYGDTQQVYDLTKYYKPHEREQGHGSINYLIQNLKEGKYRARLEVWDIHNNMSRANFSFIVQEKLAPEIKRLEVHPNPINANGNIFVTIEHNLTGSDLVAKLAIYDLAGQLLWEQNNAHLKGTTTANHTLRLTPQNLPLLSSWARGNYLLRIWLSTPDGAQSSASTKFIVQ